MNTQTNEPQELPSVARSASGNFVVAWESYGPDGSGWGIYGQRYNNSGIRQGAEFRVNSYTTGDQSDPSVAMDGSGNFVVVWQSYLQDGSDWGTYGQRYNGTGTPLVPSSE